MPESAYRGVVLAGAPGCGKRTVAFALTSLRPTYAPFPALTAAPSAGLGAESTTGRHLADLRAWAQVFHEFDHAGDRYVHDHERLRTIRERGCVPVAWVEDVAALTAFDRESDDWLAVLLWCPRDEVERSLTQGDLSRRWTADRAFRRSWDRAHRRLLGNLQRFTLTIRTDRLDAVDTARLVHLAVQSGHPSHPVERRIRT